MLCLKTHLGFIRLVIDCLILPLLSDGFSGILNLSGRKELSSAAWYLSTLTPQSPEEQFEDDLQPTLQIQRHTHCTRNIIQISFKLICGAGGEETNTISIEREEVKKI